MGLVQKIKRHEAGAKMGRKSVRIQNTIVVSVEVVKGDFRFERAASSSTEEKGKDSLKRVNIRLIKAAECDWGLHIRPKAEYKPQCRHTVTISILPASWPHPTSISLSGASAAYSGVSRENKVMVVHTMQPGK